LIAAIVPAFVSWLVRFQGDATKLAGLVGRIGMASLMTSRDPEISLPLVWRIEKGASPFFMSEFCRA